MRAVAIMGLLAAIFVAVGTPSERGSSAAGSGRTASGEDSLALRADAQRSVGERQGRQPRSLGVSLAAAHPDPPVETITITLPPPPKPHRRHVDRSPAATIARISRQVFHARWRTAACIAHFESTDGRNLYNGPSLGPWQINTAAHPWANAWRLVHDWPYSARVAYRISRGGRDWAPWTTHWRCGA